MQFAALPPEINSTRMYSGPGSGPLLAAATAWNRLAATLHSTAAAYSAAVSTLTSQGWQGPASMAMTAAVTPYVEWLTTSAARAEQTAAQAGAAANAFNQAFAMTVPPPVVAANRSQLASLVATNILGQNTPVIAANEAHYGEMWAQDVAAMESYAAQSTAASALPPFSPPAQSANSSPAQAANPAQAGPIMINLTRIRTILALIRTIALDEIGTIIPISGLGSFAVAAVALQRTIAKDQGETAATPPPSREILVSQGEGDGGLVRPGAGGAPGGGRPGAVSASAGRAVLVNGLSVPQQWAVPPEMRQLARSLPITSTAAAPAAGPAAGESPYAGLGLAGMAGGGMGGLAGLGAAASANTASTPPAAANVAPQRAVKPAANAAAKSAAGTVTIPTENVAEHLANTLAAIPGATVVVIPPTAPSQ